MAGSLKLDGNEFLVKEGSQFKITNSELKLKSSGNTVVDSSGNAVLSESGGNVSIGNVRLPTNGGIKNSAGNNVLSEANNVVSIGSGVVRNNIHSYDFYRADGGVYVNGNAIKSYTLDLTGCTNYYLEAHFHAAIIEKTNTSDESGLRIVFDGTNIGAQSVVSTNYTASSGFIGNAKHQVIASAFTQITSSQATTNKVLSFNLATAHSTAEYYVGTGLINSISSDDGLTVKYVIWRN